MIEGFGVEGMSALGVVFDGNQFPASLGFEKIFDGRMVDNFEIFISTHGTATIVLLLADDVDFFNVERVGGTDDGADVEIVFNILNSDFEWGTSLTQGGKNLFVSQAFVSVYEVSGIFHICIIS